MFNKELFEISKKAVKIVDKKKLQEENKQLEENVLSILKKNSDSIDEDGLVRISVKSKKGDGSNNTDYDALESIVSLGKQTYYEEEYSLYYTGDDYIDAAFSYPYSIICFTWNALEYNEKHKDKVKNR